MGSAGGIERVRLVDDILVCLFPCCVGASGDGVSGEVEECGGNEGEAGEIWGWMGIAGGGDDGAEIGW